MSLINEALKKAQRARNDGPAGGAAGPSDSTGLITKRAQPKSAHSMLLLVVGAVVLVVASMVATALWVARPPARPVAAVTKPAPPIPTAAPESSATPLVVMPVPSPVTAPPSTPPATAGKATAPAVATAGPSRGEVDPARPAVAAVEPKPAAVPSAAVVEPVKNPEPPVAAKPDERIHQFVEALRVTGIRSSGSDSKVLMNDRVYRVNDVVDRTLGVRLTKVATDSLTFTDANGATYVKYF